MSVWNTTNMDVTVSLDDFERAKEEAIQRGHSTEMLTVPAEVDVDEALEEATVEQLRSALSREEAGYTREQLEAIRDCFASVADGDTRTASAILGRIFDHPAQIAAAEDGMSLYSHRSAA